MNLFHNGDLSLLSTTGKNFNGDENRIDWRRAFAIFFGKLERQRNHYRISKVTSTDACFSKVEPTLVAHREFFEHRKEMMPPLTLKYLEEVFFKSN